MNTTSTVADVEARYGNSNEIVIQAHKLRKQYGRKVAVRDISFSIPKGRIVGLVGPNGAGKTSALKAMLGLAGFSGELSVLGLHPLHQRDELMKHIAFIADVATLPQWIRVRELIKLMASVHPMFSIDECRQYLSETKIRPGDKVKTLSKGMIVQLHLALVMAIDAKLLVLDEPTLGLDIMFRKRFYQHLLEEYFDGDRTIIITTHQIEEVEHILTDLIFIQDGEIVLHSDMDSMQQRYTELMVADEQLAAALALGPMHQRKVFGRHVLLFEDTDQAKLSQLGELHTPAVADLFVAIMSNPKTPSQTATRETA